MASAATCARSPLGKWHARVAAPSLCLTHGIAAYRGSLLSLSQETLENLSPPEQLKQIDICAVGPMRVSAALHKHGLIKPRTGKVVVISSQVAITSRYDRHRLRLLPRKPLLPRRPLPSIEATTCYGCLTQAADASASERTALGLLRHASALSAVTLLTPAARVIVSAQTP